MYVCIMLYTNYTVYPLYFFYVFTLSPASSAPPPALTEASILMLLPMAQASENHKAPAIEAEKETSWQCGASKQWLTSKKKYIW